MRTQLRRENVARVIRIIDMIGGDRADLGELTAILGASTSAARRTAITQAAHRVGCKYPVPWLAPYTVASIIYLRSVQGFERNVGRVERRAAPPRRMRPSAPASTPAVAIIATACAARLASSQ